MTSSGLGGKGDEESTAPEGGKGESKNKKKRAGGGKIRYFENLVPSVNIRLHSEETKGRAWWKEGLVPPLRANYDLAGGNLEGVIYRLSMRRNILKKDAWGRCIREVRSRKTRSAGCVHLG